MPVRGMYSWFDWMRFTYETDVKQGAYARKSQKKRRLAQRRAGRRRKK